MITRIGKREALLKKFCLKRTVKNKNKYCFFSKSNLNLMFPVQF